MNRPVTEADFRKPEFRDAKPEDYEIRHDGAIVRKDRWENGMHHIAATLGFNAREGFEIMDVVNAVRRLSGVLDVQANQLDSVFTDRLQPVSEHTPDRLQPAYPGVEP